MPQKVEAFFLFNDYSQQEQPQEQSSPEHSVPQVHSVPQLCSVQQLSFEAQQDAFLLLTAYKIPLVAMMANDANKMIFFMINGFFKFFVCW